jgi:hypothetical protein
MQCNQRFFGQEHFERGTPEREWCERLRILKPAMAAYEFAVKDHLPGMPSDIGGMVQIKYNGMLTVVLWDEKRKGFVAWSPRGRCYLSLGDDRRYPVTEYFNQTAEFFKDFVFAGETHVIRESKGKKYMTEFNKSMSIIKNPKTKSAVERIQLAVFDYRQRRADEDFLEREPQYLGRFAVLRDQFRFPIGVDNGPVHLPDYLVVEGDFQSSYSQLQAFWGEYITERGFEGFVMHTRRNEEYKIKFRDTLDVAIIGFRKEKKGDSRPLCPSCGAQFDLFGLIQLVRKGKLHQREWFNQKRRQIKFFTVGDPCPLCGATTTSSSGPVLGARIALMTPGGDFVAIADGVQLSPLCPILWQIEYLYEDEGYLWVKPEVVIEVSYQDLYVDRMRPVYRFENNRYQRVGETKAVCFRPYFRGIREDKSVNPRDLRLEQVSYLVNRIERIRSITETKV